MAADGGWVCTQHEYVFESFGFALVVPGIVAGFDMFSENMARWSAIPHFYLAFCYYKCTIWESLVYIQYTESYN